MIHSVQTTAWMRSQAIGETRSQEEIAAEITARNERELARESSKETTMTARKTPTKTTAIPANAKKPQDHQSPAEDATGPKDVTVEWHGHEYTIPGDAFDDLELTMLFAEHDAGALSDQEAGLKMFLAGKRMLGAEQFTEYLKNERGENGWAKSSDFMSFFNHIMEEAGRKNS